MRSGRPILGGHDQPGPDAGCRQPVLSGADGRVRTMLQGVTNSNGIAWSLDGTAMYYIDTPTRQRDGVRLRSSQRADRESAPGDHDSGRRGQAGRHDHRRGGYAVDRPVGRRMRWAMGSCARRAARHESTLPARRVTSCAFGGPRLDRTVYHDGADVGLSEVELDDATVCGRTVSRAARRRGRAGVRVRRDRCDEASDRRGGQIMTQTIVIFGASGDLTSRKLIPALYALHHKKRLPPDTRIVGFARTPFSHEAWRQRLAESTARFVGRSVRRGRSGRRWRSPDLLFRREMWIDADDFRRWTVSCGNKRRRCRRRDCITWRWRRRSYETAVRHLGAAGLAR